MVTRYFVVCVHDVAPRALHAVQHQLSLLRPLVGTVISTAVIPAAAGPSWKDVGADFLDSLRPLERMLHGFAHRRSFSLSPISLAAGQADELCAWKPLDISRCLLAGQKVLSEVFGRPADGFLPPAWRFGRVNLSDFARAGMTFQVGYRSVTHVNGLKVPLATYSWDWGLASVLGGIGAALGHLWALRDGAVPVIVLHPSDAERGYLVEALDMVKLLLTRGFVPVTFERLLEVAA